MSVLTEQGDGIRRAISAFLNERKELRGKLRPISSNRFQIHLTTDRPRGSDQPVPITKALDIDIHKFSQELCGKFGLFVRQLPNGVDNRSFELNAE